jgi:hypothetical protein
MAVNNDAEEWITTHNEAKIKYLNAQSCLRGKARLTPKSIIES